MTKKEGFTVSKEELLNKIYIGEKSGIDFPSDDEGCLYLFPKIDDIAPGDCIVNIAAVSESMTRFKKEAIDVCYNMYSFRTIYKYLKACDDGDDYEPEPDYRIRQRYVKDTDSYRNTVATLKRTKIPSKKTWEDFIGCCYVATLGYYDDYGVLTLYWEYNEEVLRDRWGIS